MSIPTGPVVVKKGIDRYVSGVSENSIKYSGNPADAMIFESYAAAQSAIYPALLEKMRVVSARTIERKKKLTVALRIDGGFYIAGLTARSLRYTRYFGDAKRFPSGDAAFAWFEQHRIAERFPTFACVTPVDGKE